MRGRFQQRPKRIARRMEREKFDRLVMPAAYICLPVAVAMIIAVGLSDTIYGTFPGELFGLGLLVLLVPIVLFLYRLVRGHYSDALDEP
jgi:hypothetical protein